MRMIIAAAMLCLFAFPAHARHAHHAGHHFKHHRLHHSGLWRHRSVSYRVVRHQRAAAYHADQDGRWGADVDQPSPDSRRPQRRIRMASLGDGGGHYGRGGRPRAWCGWYARSLVGSDPGPAYNLARNWTRWGRPASPGIGVMVVWSHHVGQITGRTADGQWIVKSGNDGHAVRERPRSIAGAIAFRAG
jgi:hypothetical protein